MKDYRKVSFVTSRGKEVFGLIMNFDERVMGYSETYLSDGWLCTSCGNFTHNKPKECLKCIENSKMGMSISSPVFIKVKDSLKVKETTHNSEEGEI